MADHDQRFKVLLREFLVEFIRLFFPELLERLDFTQVTWLQQELYLDPPQGEKLTIDLVAQLAVRPAPDGPRPNEPTQQVILIHIEIESADTVEPFRERMYDYYHFLTREHGLDVLPIAVYLRVGLRGRGKDAYTRRVWERTPLHFEYDYVGLPGLEGEDYLAQENALALAWSALMRWPRERRVQAAVEALERIVASQEPPGRKILLCECVQAYAPLEDDQRIELNSLLQEPQRAGVRAMVKTWTEEAEEQGLLRGKLEGQREILLDQLEMKFQNVSETARQRLAKWPADKLKGLARAVFTAQSLRELGLED